jgi:hypothetical protein
MKPEWGQPPTRQPPPLPGRHTRPHRHCADDWRLYRYHYHLFRQRHDFAAGRPRPHSSGTVGIQLLQQALVNLTGGWGAGFVSLILIVCLQLDCGELPLRRK